jgi:SAM-dependent methyltransferase
VKPVNAREDESKPHDPGVPDQADEIKKSVREGYAKIVQDAAGCCPPGTSVCPTDGVADSISEQIGYSDDELRSVPEGANLGLGCGNPVALGYLKAGETVLDLGSGAGLDCFLAAQKVGESGKIIGVDMTPEMVEKARANAEKGKYENVEIRLGEIESLPVADNDVDVVISNCVINLSPDKRNVFREAFRVLKPGGRMIVSDIVLSKPLPSLIKDSVEAYVACVSGAMVREEYLKCVEGAGFQDVKIIDEARFPLNCLLGDPIIKGIIEESKLTPDDLNEIAATIVSLKIEAHRAKT